MGWLNFSVCVTSDVISAVMKLLEANKWFLNASTQQLRTTKNVCYPWHEFLYTHKDNKRGPHERTDDFLVSWHNPRLPMPYKIILIFVSFVC